MVLCKNLFTRAIMLIRILLLVVAISATEGWVMCGDSQWKCAEGMTCCRTGSSWEGDDYGCCPMPNAVCCSDDRHCCPQGDTCDLQEGKCVGELGEARNWFRKVPSTPILTPTSSEEIDVKTVLCPDGQSQCPDKTTCCKLATGKYGCCPMPNAVCCKDHIHCCPQGDTCDVKEGKCVGESGEASNWFRKVPSTPILTHTPSQDQDVDVKTVICPDRQSQCPDETTCCVLPSGQYGCCPIPKAVCCTDHIHCCPHATTCNTTAQTCDHRDGRRVPLRRKGAAQRRHNVLCEDGKTECPDGSTCCRLNGGGVGCCPLPQAVCCSDHIHCCPRHTKCNIQSGSCLKKDGNSVMWSEKTSASVIRRKHTHTRSLCGGGNTSCIAGSTCCRSLDGFNCCPHKDGVCCSDKRHCCPKDTRCDLEYGECSRGEYSVKWSTTQNPHDEAESRTCRDGSECPLSSSCCPNHDNHHYSCCPVKNGVCCKHHCCPEGYKCGLRRNSCVRDMKTRTPQ